LGAFSKKSWNQHSEVDRKQIADLKNLRDSKQKQGDRDIEIDLYDPLEDLENQSDSNSSMADFQLGDQDRMENLHLKRQMKPVIINLT